MRVVCRVLPGCLLVLALAAPAWSQAVVRGTILDFQGEPIEGAAVRVEGDGYLQEYPTGADGAYSATLPPGTYTLTFLVQRQALLVENNVPVRVGEPLVRDFDMSALSDEDQERALEMLEARGDANAIRAAFDAGVAALNSGDVDTAIAQFGIAAEGDDQHIILANLAQALALGGRHEEAAQNYALALIQDPENAVYLQNRGIALGNTGDIEGAVESIARAAELDPLTAGMSYFNLGIIFVNRGQVPDAVNAFERSIDADAENAQAYYQLGLALVGTAPADAVAPLERFLELAPDDPNAQTAQGLLDFARTQ